MENSKSRILGRLRRHTHLSARLEPGAAESDPQWLAQQPPLGDLAERFIAEASAVAAEVRPIRDWKSLEAVVPAWLVGVGVKTVMMGEEPRLAPLRKAISAQPGLAVLDWRGPVEEQRPEIFAVDCGITTALGALAETGTLILSPTPAEPRLLSLAPPVHLAVVERGSLYGRLAEYAARGDYQRTRPTNLVLITGPSRTADIELILALGVHGPRRLLVALVG